MTHDNTKAPQEILFNLVTVHRHLIKRLLASNSGRILKLNIRYRDTNPGFFLSSFGTRRPKNRQPLHIKFVADLSLWFRVSAIPALGIKCRDGESASTGTTDEFCAASCVLIATNTTNVHRLGAKLSEGQIRGIHSLCLT